MTNWKGFGRSCRYLILRDYPDIRVEGLRKIMKINSLRIAVILAKIRAWDLPDTKQECPHSNTTSGLEVMMVAFSRRDTSVHRSAVYYDIVGRQCISV
jgi:hypothetical protein